MTEENERFLCAYSGNQETRISSFIGFTDPLKSRILDEIGEESWGLWLEEQLKIINEYRLNLSKPEAREILERSCSVFFRFSEEEAGQPETGPTVARELGNLPDDEPSGP